jgi:hypothetical protein
MMILIFAAVPVFAAKGLINFGVTIEQPRVGKQLSYEATLPETSKACVTKVEWDGKLDSNGKVIPGESYTVNVHVSIKDGVTDYQIFKLDSGKVQVNKNTAELTNISKNKQKAVVTYTFGPISSDPFDGMKSVSSFNLSATRPMEGNALDYTSVERSSSTKVEVTKVDWKGELDANGKVKDKSGDAKVGTIIGGNADLYWVVDYNAEEDALEIIEVPSVSDNADLEDAVENAQVYRINVEDVKVSIIGHQSAALNADMVRWGSIKVADVAKLDGSDKSYLATAKWAKDEDSALKTVYSNYVKIYLDAEWEDEDDYTAIDEDDFNAEANFIVVVANNNESTALCKLK